VIPSGGSNVEEMVLEDRFVVFLRPDRMLTCAPETVEEPLGHFPSYVEAACWVRREYHWLARKCIIRFVGPAGGGD
jgi:hypothetical protein